MKMIKSLVLLCAALNAQAAIAQEQIEPESTPFTEATPAPQSEPYVTPFELAYLGYEGQLRAQGIPGYQSFCFQRTQGIITLKGLAAAAVKAGYLSQKKATDENYLGYLLMNLQNICKF